jgi:ABC-2 type transport system permease protein
VVEVLLAHVTPTQLITGKVIGLGLLAMGQALVVLIGLIGALLVTDSVDVPSSAWGAVALMLAIVAAGFAFYSVMFAAGGSLVSRTEDAQQVMMPLMLPLMGGYFVSTASLTNPENPLVTVLSFLPFTMRTVMPLRLAGGAAQWWEVALAFAILLGSTVLVARLAGRLYHVSLLQAGSRIKWRDALTIIRN